MSTAALPSSVRSWIFFILIRLGDLRRDQIEFLDRLVGLGQGQADRRGQHRPDLCGLLLAQVQPGGVEPGQRGDSQHRQADLVLEHGDEPVELGAATSDQHPRHGQPTGQRGKVLDRVADLADQFVHAGLGSPLGRLHLRDRPRRCGA